MGMGIKICNNFNSLFNLLRNADLFKWTPKAPRAGLLTVLNNNYYVALDTSSSPPKKMKIVMVSTGACVYATKLP